MFLAPGFVPQLQVHHQLTERLTAVATGTMETCNLDSYEGLGAKEIQEDSPGIRVYGLARMKQTPLYFLKSDALLPIPPLPESYRRFQ